MEDGKRRVNSSPDRWGISISEITASKASLCRRSQASCPVLTAAYDKGLQAWL